MNEIKKPRIALLNDTSLYSTHFGCQLVGQAFREQFKRVGLDLVISLPKNDSYLNEYSTTLANVDLVVVNGEGSIHHGRNEHLINVACRYPSVLLNATYEKNPENEALRKFLYITVRESLSAGEVSAQGVVCHIVPDVIFNSSFIKSFPRTTPIHAVGVTDNVLKEYAGKWPFRKKITGDFPAHGMTPAEYLSKISSYKRICAGRFHAAVVCSIFNIPFSSWDSNTCKTRGMMEDMGVGHLHFSNRREALNHIPDNLPCHVNDFVQTARIKIETMFDEIAVIARNQMLSR